jgi:general secretion pathway protein G
MKRTLVTILVLTGLASGACIGLRWLPRWAPEYQQARTRVDVRAYLAALELFRRDTGRYPTPSEGLRILTSANAEQGVASSRRDRYVNRLVSDPWGNPYLYCTNSDPESRPQISICSYGADGAAGGSADNSDYCASPENADNSAGFAC